MKIQTSFFNVSKRFFLMASFTAAVIVGIPMLAHAEMLTRQLDLGMAGTDVSSLQSFLAQDNTIYPQGLITGYFGGLTRTAVGNFQVRNNLPSVGRVGPATLSLINTQMGGSATGTNSLGRGAVISSVNVNTSRNNAFVSWNTDELAKGVVYYSTTPLVMYEKDPVPEIYGTVASTDMNLCTSQTVSIQNLQPNTTYYYLVHTTDQDGNVNVTWPTTFQTSN